MNPLLRTLLCAGLALLVSSVTSQAKSSNWTDLQGNSFKAEPSGVYGPFAVFKASTGGSRRVLVRNLKPEDLKRFCQEVAPKPPQAASWAKSKSRFGSEFIGRVMELKGEKLVPADLANRPEPEVYVLFFGTAWGPESYETSALFRAAYNRLKRLYGPKMEVIFLGVRHDDKGNANIATAVHMPWLVADYREQPSLSAFTRFAPAEGQAMIAVTREGVPLVMNDVKNVPALCAFIDELSGLMSAADPENRLFYPDIAAWLTQSRPLAYANSQAEPLILNNPFQPAALRKVGITRIVAKLKVAADGKVLSATLGEGSVVPEVHKAAIEGGLVAGCVAFPAIDKGKPVEGTVGVDFNIAPEDEALELDRTWAFVSTHKDIPIQSWLLLRPIPVPEAAFSQVQGVDDKGVTTMTAFKVGSKDNEAISHKSQMNAFNSDFFSEAGAGAVRPIEGLVQTVDEVSYTWEKVNSASGLVDFASAKNKDFCVGYAYAEF